MPFRRKSANFGGSIKGWLKGFRRQCSFTACYAIPTGFSPGATPAITPEPHDHYKPWSELTEEEKRELVDRSQILHGIQLQFSNQLCFANAPIARLPYDAPFPAQPLNTAAFSSQSVYSYGESALVDKGFTAISANLAIPFASATNGVKHGSERGTNTTRATFFVTARYTFPRVLVKTSFDGLIPNPEFVRDVSEALAEDREDALLLRLKKVLEDWGQVIPTYVELGCSLVSSAELVSTNAAHDRKQELAVKAGLEVIIAKYAGGVNLDIGSSKEEKAAAQAWAQRLDVRVVGGTSSMASSVKDLPEWRRTIEDPGSWAIIGIDGIRPTVDLLASSHPELYTRVLPLVEKLRAKPPPTAPAPPMFHFPHRLSSWKYGSCQRVPGYVEAALPSFVPGAEYTLATWVLVGARGLFAQGVFLSVESPAAPASLVTLGFTRGQRYFAAVDGAGMLAVDARVKGAFEGGRWYHVGLVRDGERLRLYVDGAEVDSVAVPEGAAMLVDVDRPRVCIGRASADGKRCDGWDGQVEDVKIWARALSKAEVEAQARGQPVPGGWSGSRFPSI